MKYASPTKINNISPERAQELLEDATAIRDGKDTVRVSCWGYPYPDCPERKKIDVWIKHLRKVVKKVKGRLRNDN